MIRKVFIANRGEIAVRIVRACKAMGIDTVLGVSEADRESLGAALAGRAICVGPPQAAKSYLNAEAIVAAAKGTGCDAIHPGYGFLSERAQFQRMCTDAGLAFIGPSSDAIEQMGDKINAIKVARRVGVPIVPGRSSISTSAEVHVAARELGFPLLLKASAGGGGRGMRVVQTEKDIDVAFANARAEAMAAFGDGTLYLEKYIEKARHIEIQVLGDRFGNVVHLYERDCTVQRRHQKLIEESPSPVLSPAVRGEMAEAALALAREVRYTNAGTVEFVFDADDEKFYFLEMNTRIQVEHPVTEMVTGLDIVREQIAIADGRALSFGHGDIRPHGCAIECRINAEDPRRNFAPCPGRIRRWRPPVRSDVRLDTHCFEGYSVPPYYDSMLAKAIIWAPSRQEALSGLEGYLGSFEVDGVVTTIPFQREIVTHRRFNSGEVTKTWVERELQPRMREGGLAA